MELGTPIWFTQSNSRFIYLFILFYFILFFCRKVKYVYEHLFDTADEGESGVQGIEDGKNCTVLNCANSRCITFLVLALF